MTQNTSIAHVGAAWPQRTTETRPRDQWRPRDLAWPTPSTIPNQFLRQTPPAARTVPRDHWGAGSSHDQGLAATFVVENELVAALLCLQGALHFQIENRAVALRSGVVPTHCLSSNGQRCFEARPQDAALSMEHSL